MKRMWILAVILAAMLTGCAAPLAPSAPPESAQAAGAVTQMHTPEKGEDKPAEKGESAESAAEQDEPKEAEPKEKSPTVEQPAPTPESEPTPEPTPAPTPEPLPQPETEAVPIATPAPAPIANGAIPFGLSAETQTWWYIDSTDSAYWAVQTNINAMRAAVGLPPLTMSDSLSAAASSRCKSFVAGGPFDHSGMTTRSEICAAGPLGSAAAVCDAWKNSPNHYANIVHQEFTSMGVSCWFCSTPQGNYTYWTVTFE